MATRDEGSEMNGSTTGGLDALAVPELPDTVWMRLLANAMDPDTAPVNPGLVPADDATWPADDGAAAAGDPAGDGTDGDDAAGGSDADDASDDGSGGMVDHDPHDGGAHLLPSADAFPAHDPSAHDLGGPAGFPGGPTWSDPHDDHGF
ncbi:hypothetical protein [Nakamurella deserti]|uniref:hypothetical protein n=1 Tax=Nakamurella deserti TaxID=2164074 RepID=UPI00130091A0|nr:hypothetical protein [Nakamurella deserti]